MQAEKERVSTRRTRILFDLPTAESLERDLETLLLGTETESLCVLLGVFLSM